jgi:hypothetical protein
MLASFVQDNAPLSDSGSLSWLFAVLPIPVLFVTREEN